MPADADTITGAQVSHLLQMLSSEFAYVVVDTAPGLSEFVLAAMDETDELVLVTSMDVPGVRGLRKELDALTQLGMLSHARHVVLNFAEAKGGLSVADIEATLDTRVDVLLPRSKTTLQSVNLGVPLLQTNARRDLMTKQLRQLVSRLTSAPIPAVSAATKDIQVRRSAKEPEPAARPKRAAPRFSRLRRAAT